ncbi:hypothetical protein SAMN05443574_104244 [Haloarcula vallismortis]|uniref:Uncharacterized protein n=1 Tax=Haloarcula vallismortis TaxID=28442 RepID=A0A1H2UIK5_HALVA|nr:hypothetical protein SAMN05443574_104244 [Haloarcula vallismortis]
MNGPCVTQAVRNRTTGPAHGYRVPGSGTSLYQTTKHYGILTQ